MPSQLNKKRVCRDRERSAELGEERQVEQTHLQCCQQTQQTSSSTATNLPATQICAISSFSLFSPLRNLISKGSKMSFPSHSQCESQKQQKQNPVWWSDTYLCCPLHCFKLWLARCLLWHKNHTVDEIIWRILGLSELSLLETRSQLPLTDVFRFWFNGPFRGREEISE